MSQAPESNTPATIEALQDELARVRAKNAELLAELKAAKATASDVQAAQAALQGERDAALADVRALRLDAPVASLLADVATEGAADVFASLWARHYRFELGEDGRPCVVDLDGKPATVTDDEGKARPAQFTRDDVEKLAQSSPSSPAFKHVMPFRAHGGGASGSARPPVATTSTPDKPTAPAAQPFGLR